MRHSYLTRLQCPRCGGPLAPIAECWSGERVEIFGEVGCDCDAWPIVAGILVDDSRKRADALDALRRNDVWAAVALVFGAPHAARVFHTLLSADPGERRAELWTDRFWQGGIRAFAAEARFCYDSYFQALAAVCHPLVARPDAGIVVETGAGIGYFSWVLGLLQPDRPRVVCDIDARYLLMATVLDPGLACVLVSADHQQLPLPDHSVGALFDHHAFSIYGNQDCVAREIDRLLAPDGVLALTGLELTRVGGGARRVASLVAGFDPVMLDARAMLEGFTSGELTCDDSLRHGSVRATLFGERQGRHRGARLALDPDAVSRLQPHAAVNPRYERHDDDRGTWFRQIRLGAVDRRWSLTGCMPETFGQVDLADPLDALRRGLLVPLSSALWPIEDRTGIRSVSERPWRHEKRAIGRRAAGPAPGDPAALWHVLLRVPDLVLPEPVVATLVEQAELLDALDDTVGECLWDGESSPELLIACLRLLCVPAVRDTIADRHIAAAVRLLETAAIAEVRHAAATVLASSLDDRAVAALLAAVDQPDETVQEIALAGLAVMLADRPDDQRELASRFTPTRSLVTWLGIARVLADLGAANHEIRAVLDSAAAIPSLDAQRQHLLRSLVEQIPWTVASGASRDYVRPARQQPFPKKEQR